MEKTLRSRPTRRGRSQNQQGSSTLAKVRKVPKLIVHPEIKPVEAFDPDGTYQFSYEAKVHRELPHVMKFSGGRSSGMLLFVLLEGGLLKPERGDVVVFNNTSAEHPETYHYAAKCKRVVEERYGIPFFWVEFQTYEDARNGEWARLPAYRLVKPVPWSDEEPDGYHWKGEAFEEMLSWAGYVPNQFQRTCTKTLKLETTRFFLRDWFACKEGIDRLGHYGSGSRLDDDEIYAKHLRHRGGVPKDIFIQKKSYVKSRPAFRSGQHFRDFSHVVQPIENKHLVGKQFGNSAYFGKGGIEYTAFVGLRHDEMRRVIKVRRRNTGGPESDGYEGEYVYMPLENMGVTREDVENFWSQQNWDLALPSDAGLSNCVYCFLKGLNGLQRVHQKMKKTDFVDSPCDIDWWRRIEQQYGRDLVAEKREVKGDIKTRVIGFFGVSSGFSYDLLAMNDKNKVNTSKFSKSVLPCDCTD